VWLLTRGCFWDRSPRLLVAVCCRTNDRRCAARASPVSGCGGFPPLWGPPRPHPTGRAVVATPDETDAYKPSGMERKLGLIVARGTSVMTISPADGVGVLHENPFVPEGAEP